MTVVPDERTDQAGLAPGTQAGEPQASVELDSSGSASFDQFATGYDAVAESALGDELRRRVRLAIDPLIGIEDDAADLGCGSGLDAAWLAGRARSVRAFDLSHDMVALAKSRCAGMPDVHLEQADVSKLTLDPPVDFVLANFGVVNCVGDFSAFGNRLASLLAPGGRAVVVTMTRCCPIELAIGAATLNRSLISRRFGETNYHGTSVRYASARTLARHFEPWLDLVSAESLGAVLPPFEQRGWFQSRAGLLNSFARADQAVAAAAARVGIGDHHIAVFAKRP